MSMNKNDYIGKESKNESGYIVSNVASLSEDIPALKGTDVVNGDSIRTSFYDNEMYLEVCNPNGIIKDLVRIEDFVDKVNMTDITSEGLFETIEQSAKQRYEKAKKWNTAMNILLAGIIAMCVLSTAIVLLTV